MCDCFLNYFFAGKVILVVFKSCFEVPIVIVKMMITSGGHIMVEKVYKELIQQQRSA